MTNKSPQVFISYAREDYEPARRMRDDLRQRKCNVWFDRESIRGGEKWALAISKAIRESDFFLALLSSVSVGKKGVVQREIREAISVLEKMPEDDIFIVPARLEECEPSFQALRNI